MAKVKNPQGTVVDQAPVINNNLPTPGTKKSTYCMLCRLCLFKDNEQAHIHSMLHHRELDSVLGTRSFHNCQACMVSSMGLQEFAQHISTAEHKYKLEKLICKKQKPIPLEDHLSQEDLDKVRRRNKRLKKMRTKKNQREKKAKQMKKEMAMKACAKIAQGVPQQNKVASSVLKQNKTKQKNTTKIKHETHLKGSSSVVVQNKENKASTLQKPPHQRETARLPDVPAEPPRHQTSVRDQFTPPIPQMRSGASFSVNSVKVDQFHTERPQQSPHNTEEGPRLHKIMLPAIIEYDIHERQCDNSVNFTSDNIAGCRGLIFDDMQNESPRSTELEQEGSHRSAAPAPANTSISAAPIRVVDVSSMLRQIRRELGVREPCRADREAKKQKSEVRARPAGHSSSQKAGREKRQLSGAASTSVRAPLVNNSCAPAAHPKGHSSSVAKTKQATLKTSQEATRRLSAASAPSNRSALSGKPTFTKPSLNFDHRVQSAHEPSKSHETRLKPTLTNLLTLSGPRGG
ncbi:hypothetical protein INR49_002047 [Caranx melampygus]|nr:hypothetical protein INR49_002047 [Caranx melampygus]